MNEELNENGLTYKAWMRRVDGILAARIGVTSDDLADGASYDSWEAGGSPEDYASDLMYDEGFGDDDDEEDF